MQVNHYVIDASFARGTGRPNTNLTALRCSQILQRIVQGAHLCVFNKALRDEWHRHASPTAKAWLMRMIGRRKHLFIEVAPNAHLRKLLLKQQLSDLGRTEIEKDLHLLELALAHEKIIVTFEKELQRHLKSEPNLAKIHSQITWISDDPNAIPVANSKP